MGGGPVARYSIISRHDHAGQHSLLLLLSFIFLHSRNYTELLAMPPILTYPLDTRDADLLPNSLRARRLLGRTCKPHTGVLRVNNMGALCYSCVAQ